MEQAGALMHEIAELGRGSLGVARFLERALQTIRRRIPFDRGNVALLDPVTAMPTFLLLDPGCAPEFVARTCAFEMTSGHDSTFHNLAHRPRPAVRLSGERHRAIQLRRRYEELLRPQGVEDELKLSMRADGVTWGGLALGRAVGEPHFDDSDVAELARTSSALTAGLRRAILAEPIREARSLDGPAVIVLSPDDHVVSCTDTAQALLDRITYGGSHGGGLPLVVKAVALQARQPKLPTVACSRLRTRDGTWITVRGATLDHGRNVAIVMEPSRATEVVSLLLDAYGLTRRESQIAQCVIQAFSTEDVATLLGISPYTVQDHLKSVFDKMGLSSRRELTARLLFTHRLPPGEGYATTLADDPFSAVSRRPRVRLATELSEEGLSA